MQKLIRLKLDLRYFMLILNIMKFKKYLQYSANYIKNDGALYFARKVSKFSNLVILKANLMYKNIWNFVL